MKTNYTVPTQKNDSLRLKLQIVECIERGGLVTTKSFKSRFSIVKYR